MALRARKVSRNDVLLSFCFDLEDLSNTQDPFVGYPNTLNFFKNTPLHLIIFSTLFSMIGYPYETLSLVMMFYQRN